MEDNKTKIKMLETSINRMNIENENIRKKQEKQNAHIKMQEEKIEEYKKQIEELKKEDVVWKPEEGENYYGITSVGEIIHFINNESQIANQRFAIGDFFKTREEAEKAVRHLKTRAKLQRIADRLNNGQEIDWNDIYQNKWYLYYDYEKNQIYEECNYCNKTQGTIYCLSTWFDKYAIKEIGEEELTAYLKGE